MSKLAPFRYDLFMRLFQSIITLFLLIPLLAPIGRAQYRPLRSDAARYLEFLREEQAELDFQLRRGEVTHSFYLRASQRLRILRELVTSYGRDGAAGRLPEFHVVLGDELDALIPDGRKRLKQARPHQVIDGKWRFLKTVVRGETFYVLERLNDSSEQGSNQ